MKKKPRAPKPKKVEIDVVVSNYDHSTGKTTVDRHRATYYLYPPQPIPPLPRYLRMTNKKLKEYEKMRQEYDEKWKELFSGLGKTS